VTSVRGYKASSLGPYIVDSGTTYRWAQQARGWQAEVLWSLPAWTNPSAWAGSSMPPVYGSEDKFSLSDTALFDRPVGGLGFAGRSAAFLDRPSAQQGR
jgi:hypothetical protein